MKLQVVSMDEIDRPSVRAPLKDVRKILDDFWNSGNPIMRVDYEEGEYTNVSSAKASFIRVIRASNYNVVSIMKNGKLYLVRLSNMK